MVKRGRNHPAMSVSPPPSWEIVNLVASYVDGKSLAMGSCVSKSWNDVMSSDSVWRRAYAADYPLHFSRSGVFGVDPLVSFRGLYAASYTAAKRRRILPRKPVLSLNDLVFVISLAFKGGASVDVAKPGDEIAHESDGVFKFDIGVEEDDGRDLPFDVDADREEDVKVTCDVVLKGGKSMFQMMNLEGKVKLHRGSMGLFSDELPATGSSVDATSGIVSDMKYLRYGNGSDEVHKLVVGLMSSNACSYLSVDGGLRYLQQFLLSPMRTTDISFD